MTTDEHPSTTVVPSRPGGGTCHTLSLAASLIGLLAAGCASSRDINTSAAASLDEGFEETLTLHRLGLFQALGVSLKTTNCLESLNAQLGQVTDKVDRWRTSDQKQRWVASALLTIEPRLRRIKGYRHLSRLRTALQAEIRRVENREHTRVA